VIVITEFVLKEVTHFEMGEVRDIKSRKTGFKRTKHRRWWSCCILAWLLEVNVRNLHRQLICIFKKMHVFFVENEEENDHLREK